MKKISIIVPCYNEEEVINLFYKKINEVVLSKITEKYNYEILFVDDGSKDNTLSLLKELKLIESMLENKSQ